jgi:transposase-like protein
MADVFPEVAEQRCWNHKICNVLDRLPRRRQAEARELLRQVAYADTRREAERLRDLFVERFGDDHPAAGDTLLRDWPRMVTFFDFPREHWKHLRTTNPVESPFAAVRLRTDAGKRYKKVANATALIWRLLSLTALMEPPMIGIKAPPGSAGSRSRTVGLSAQSPSGCKGGVEGVLVVLP